MILKFQPIHQEEHPAGVARAEEEPNNGSRGEGLASARGHFKQEAVATAFHGLLNGMDGFLLVGT